MAEIAVKIEVGRKETYVVCVRRRGAGEAVVSEVRCVWRLKRARFAGWGGNWRECVQVVLGTSRGGKWRHVRSVLVLVKLG